MADTTVGEIHEVRKGLWAFLSWLCFSDADWLSSHTLITWQWRRSGWAPGIWCRNGRAGKNPKWELYNWKLQSTITSSACYKATCLDFWSHDGHGTLWRVLSRKGVMWRTEHFSIVCCIDVVELEPVIVGSFCLGLLASFTCAVAKSENTLAGHWTTNGWLQQKLPKFSFRIHTTALWAIQQSSISFAKFNRAVAPVPEVFTYNCCAWLWNLLIVFMCSLGLG